MKTATKRVLLSGAAALLAAGSLAACSNGAASNGGGSTGASASAGSSDNAKIGLLLPDAVTARYESADRPYFTAEVKAKCPSCTVLYQNAAGSASTQQQQAEAMLNQGVKVLVLDPFDGVAAASIVNEAKAKNVPVVSYDRLIDSGDLAAYISFDNEKVGQLQGQALVDKLKEDGVKSGSGIIMIDGSPTDNNATYFKKGAHSVIDSSGYKVLGEYDTPGWDPAKAGSWASSNIPKIGLSKITGVYAANDDTAGAVISALKTAGANPIPPTTGQDASLAGIQRILAGTQYMTVYKAFKPEATQAADIAVQLAKGEKPSLSATAQTASGKSAPAVLLTPVAVTIDNINDTVIKDGLYTKAQVCTSAYADACKKAGIE